MYNTKNVWQILDENNSKKHQLADSSYYLKL